MSAIPKIIHQTWKSKSIPAYLQSYIDTWQQKNPNWEYRFYDDQDCLEFIKKYCPCYLAVYEQLPKPVERADFFRYLVLFYCGGVYADVDTSCEQPIDTWLDLQKQVVVGLESDTTVKLAKKYNLSQPRTYCQWTFAAAPTTAFLREVVEAVATNASNSDLSTLYKTGPAMFTPIVERHLIDPGFQVLPVSAFASGQAHSQAVFLPRSKIYVIHHFFGSWKDQPRKKISYQESMQIYNKKFNKRLTKLNTWRKIL